LLSDMLVSGRSAILYQELVKNQRLFSELDCYITADIDLANSEADQYLKVNLQTLKAMGKDMLRAENCSTLFYISKNAK